MYVCMYVYSRLYIRVRTQVLICVVIDMMIIMQWTREGMATLAALNVLV